MSQTVYNSEMINSVLIASLLFLLFIIVTLLYLFSPSFRSKTLTLSSQKREYLLHLPSGYRQKNAQKLPLVIALHGFTDRPRVMELYSGWSRKADQENFIVVYPRGSNSEKYPKTSWNAKFCCGVGVVENIDDVTFISELIDELIKNYSVDAEKVHVVGFSNGGMMTYRLAQEIPEKIAGIGVVAGTVAGKNPSEASFTEFSPPSKQLRTIILHGTLDDTVPLRGGLNKAKDKEFKSFAHAEEVWKNSYDCSLEMKTENLNHSVTAHTYSCDNKQLLKTLVFQNSGHVWFGWILEWQNILQGKTARATDLIWEFFNVGLSSS